MKNAPNSKTNLDKAILRFAGEIHYNADVDEKLLQTAVPSMILQPIVENCIKHGLRDVEWEKKIDLSVYSEGDSTVISIRDNGVGIPDAVIERILNNKLNEDDNIVTSMVKFNNALYFI